MSPTKCFGCEAVGRKGNSTVVITIARQISTGTSGPGTSGYQWAWYRWPPHTAGPGAQEVKRRTEEPLEEIHGRSTRLYLCTPPLLTHLPSSPALAQVCGQVHVYLSVSVCVFIRTRASVCGHVCACVYLVVVWGVGGGATPGSQPQEVAVVWGGPRERRPAGPAAAPGCCTTDTPSSPPAT